jgi:phage/conjugal plasmid C-4 type zinc finger TraR family protein
MMDEADRAQNIIERDLENAIKAARGVMPVDRVSADTCAICSLEIPSSRQVAVPGCTMCKDCAEEWESRIRRGL